MIVTPYQTKRHIVPESYIKRLTKMFEIKSQAGAIIIQAEKGNLSPVTYLELLRHLKIHYGLDTTPKAIIAELKPLSTLIAFTDIGKLTNALINLLQKPSYEALSTLLAHTKTVCEQLQIPPEKRLAILPPPYKKALEKVLRSQGFLNIVTSELSSKRKGKRMLRIMHKRFGLYQRKKPPFSAAKLISRYV